jgi:hypothetical protein
MRKEFDSINFLNLKYITDTKETEKYSPNNVTVYVPGKNNIISYKYDDGKIDKLYDYSFSDEILNFHPVRINDEECLVIIGKSNKIIALFDSKGEKIEE